MSAPTSTTSDSRKNRLGNPRMTSSPGNHKSGTDQHPETDEALWRLFDISQDERLCYFMTLGYQLVLVANIT